MRGWYVLNWRSHILHGLSGGNFFIWWLEHLQCLQLWNVCGIDRLNIMFTLRVVV